MWHSEPKLLFCNGSQTHRETSLACLTRMVAPSECLYAIQDTQVAQSRGWLRKHGGRQAGSRQGRQERDHSSQLGTTRARILGGHTAPFAPSETDGGTGGREEEERRRRHGGRADQSTCACSHGLCVRVFGRCRCIHSTHTDSEMAHWFVFACACFVRNLRATACVTKMCRCTCRTRT